MAKHAWYVLALLVNANIDRLRRWRGEIDGRGGVSKSSKHRKIE